MHNIYKTNSFVIRFIPSGEADGRIALFTKDFGFIWAKAQGIRHLKSKLRFSLQPYMLNEVALVRGKGEWRITNAKESENLHKNLSHESFLVLAHIFALIEKLLPGEEENKELFSIILSGYEFIDKNTLEKRHLHDVEHILVMRILNNLGYIGERARFHQFISNDDWNMDLLEEMNKNQKLAREEINRALRGSQLV